jgi:hypothetical protein
MTVLNVRNAKYLWNGILFLFGWENITVIVRRVGMSLIHKTCCQNRSDHAHSSGSLNLMFCLDVRF